MQIVDFFYLLARTHKLVKGFRYGKPSAKGAGSDAYPLVWLDDPISGGLAAAPNPKAFAWQVNVDILGIPTNDDDVPAVQAAALLVGLGFVERAKAVHRDTGVAITNVDFISLRDYYDDKAAGQRFTYSLSAANPIDRCADDFNPDKVFTSVSPLPSFDVDAAQGCAVFNDKPGLANFDVRLPGAPQDAQMKITNRLAVPLPWENRGTDDEVVEVVRASGVLQPGESYTTAWRIEVLEVLYVNIPAPGAHLAIGSLSNNAASTGDFAPLWGSEQAAQYIAAFGSNETVFTPLP